MLNEADNDKDGLVGFNDFYKLFN